MYSIDAKETFSNIAIESMKSFHLNNRKLRSLNSNINKESLHLKKTIEKFEKNDYYCENDVLAEANRFIEESKLTYHLLENIIIAEERVKKRSKPGKPKAGEVPEIEKWYI